MIYYFFSIPIIMILFQKPLFSLFLSFLPFLNFALVNNKSCNAEEKIYRFCFSVARTPQKGPFLSVIDHKCILTDSWSKHHIYFLFFRHLYGPFVIRSY